MERRRRESHGAVPPSASGAATKVGERLRAPLQGERLSNGLPLRCLPCAEYPPGLAETQFAPHSYSRSISPENKALPCEPQEISPQIHLTFDSIS